VLHIILGRNHLKILDKKRVEMVAVVEVIFKSLFLNPDITPPVDGHCLLLSSPNRRKINTTSSRKRK